ncbi:MAG: MFS transporter, partial [Candidatus Hydrogenedentes bacterium]|nr:MFS transporter [Candidatus Hydrogenedentota bacterium]
MIARWFCLAHRRMYLAAFLLDFSVAIGLTAMPFFIYERLNGGVALSGTVGAVQMAVYAIGCFLSAGFVSRARNSLHLALLGVAVFALMFATLPWVSTSALCIVTASAPFLGLALAWPALQAWLGQEPDPVARARHLAGFNIATAFGFTLSPLLAGPLYDADFRLPFIALVALCVAVLGLIVSLSRVDARPRAEQGEQDNAQD